MSTTLNMLTDQAAFGRSALAAETVSAAPASFSAAGNGFPGEFLELPLQDEENLWGLSPLSPNSALPAWTVKADQAFANPGMERGLKNSHVRNGQPTPPPYDDKKGGVCTLTQAQLDGTTADVELSLPRKSYSGHYGGESNGTGGSGNSNSSSAKRRKVREPQSSSSVGGLTPPETDDQQQERAKREKFLERNRLAASKCRQKKKEHTMQLESRYKEQSDKKESLVAEIARLRSEILGLKNEVLKHAQCGDEPIKLHLAQMVKKITYNDAAADFADGPEMPSSSESVATPKPPTTLSFGFDDPLQLDPPAAAAAAAAASGETLEQQLRRGSETSVVSDASFAFSADDNFEDLINV